MNNNHVDNPDNFHARALKTLDRAYQLDDDQLKGEAHLLLMRRHSYHVLFTMDSIYHHGEKAITLFKHTNDQANLAATSAELGYEYVEKNEIDRAEKLIFEAITIYEGLGDKKGVGSTYLKLASLFRNQKEPGLSIKYGLKALEISEEIEDHYSTAMSWMRLIRAYQDNGELEQAIQAGNNCIATVDNYVPEEKFLLARGYAYRGDVWLDLGNYQKSLEDNMKSYAIVEAKIGTERPAAKTYREGIGHAYYLQGNYNDALPHFTASIDGYVDLGQDRHPAMQKLYDAAADCYYQLGDYKKAYLNQQLAHAVFDTLMQKRINNLESEALFTSSRKK